MDSPLKTAGIPAEDLVHIKRFHLRALFLPFFILLLSAAFSLPADNTNISDHYLLMEPIGRSFLSGDFSELHTILAPYISIQMEAPFDLRGYVHARLLVGLLYRKFLQLRVEKNEWASKQLEGDYAVQSLNLILRHARSGKLIYYKFIFFLQKKARYKWEIYFIKGLNI